MLPIEFVIELFAYLIILIAVYWFSGIHQYITKLSRSVFIFLILFFYLMVVGQVNKTPSQTYPFVNWSMYSQTTPSPSYTEHIITLQDGSRKHYPYEVVTFTSPRAFMRKVERIEAESQEERSALLQETIESLIEIYEKEYSNHKVISFALIENIITIPADGVGYDKSSKKKFLYELN